ncbi:MAG: FecR domain-containing protein [Chitinophagaceae bacterium]|nr:FecR domain-containing protein [Chitinophagaceae bacterium]
MQPAQRKLFLEKFATSTNTEAEHQQFIEWLKSAPVTDVKAVLEEFKSTISENQSSAVEVDLNLVSYIEAALDQYELGKQRKNSNNGKIITWHFFRRVAAASLIIFISGTAAYFTFRTTKNNTIAKALPQQLKNVVVPGSNKAILTLSDGSTIILDDTKYGQVAQQGGTQIAKLANGQLVYNALDDKPAEVVFNSLTTPRGGQFKLTLPDGSVVWLNAGSSIKYPTAFIDDERKVEISGEVYFEIAHDAAKPFKVSVKEMEVKVLGTRFNINAYNNEASVKTTLLEGSISLAKANAVTTLNPGQQAQLENGGNIKVINNVDMDQVVAWKNGYFSFNRADLQMVMRQIARWYDVEIDYEGKIPERQFGGKIDRNSNISEVLKILEESKVHFRIEEKKIIVSP